MSHTNSQKQQNKISFFLMAWEFKLRDWLRPPELILREAGIHAGMKIIDFGCGSGGFTLAAAKLTGGQGLVYAIDIQKIALQYVESTARRMKLKNIITAENLDDIENDSVDFAILYDLFHDFDDAYSILLELHCKLKVNGVISASDHHLKKNNLLKAITKDGLFQHKESNKWTAQFIKKDKLQNGAKG